MLALWQGEVLQSPFPKDQQYFQPRPAPPPSTTSAPSAPMSTSRPQWPLALHSETKEGPVGNLLPLPISLRGHVLSTHTGCSAKQYRHEKASLPQVFVLFVSLFRTTHHAPRPPHHPLHDPSGNFKFQISNSPGSALRTCTPPSLHHSIAPLAH